MKPCKDGENKSDPLIDSIRDGLLELYHNSKKVIVETRDENGYEYPKKTDNRKRLVNAGIPDHLANEFMRNVLEFSCQIDIPEDDIVEALIRAGIPNDFRKKYQS